MNAARLWPAAIVAVLALTVAANALLLWKASDPRGLAAEPDYYSKAVRWDSTLAVERASAALGWTAHAALGVPRAGAARVEVSLRDSTGAPVGRATVSAALLHNADPARWIRGTLVESGGGRYAAELPLARAGRWELRLLATRGSERFVADLRLETGSGAMP
jgi:nitrogen fixation protein FixH